MKITDTQHNVLLKELAQAYHEQPLDPRYEFTIDMLLKEMQVPISEAEHRRVGRRLDKQVLAGTLSVRKALHNSRLTNIYRASQT